jgi:hypothetical protein
LLAAAAGGLVGLSRERREIGPKLRLKMNAREAHRRATMMFSTLMALIGVALIAQAVGGRGSVLSPRLLLGALFLAAGLGRLYVEVRRGRAES